MTSLRKAETVRFRDRLVPSSALQWRRLDGYLPDPPTGFAWYERPIDRPAVGAERYRYVRVRRGRLAGHVQCLVTVGWRYELAPFPPRMP